MSITLNSAKQVSINGVSVENDTTGGCCSFSIDYIGNTATLVFQIGAILNGNLNIGVYSTLVTVNVNLTTGVWSSSNGQSGTLTGVAFTNFVTQMKADRNLFETFAAGASNIMPGTQVSW
jgi:hypothetical protein